MIKVNHYDSTATQIVRVSEHETRKLAHAVVVRANKAGKIAHIVHERTASDPPTAHH